MTDAGEPDFMKIRRYVIDTIAANGAQPTVFPSTHKLAKMFGVSQPTALRAVRDLIAEGHLSARPGGGTVSCPQRLQGFNEEFRIFGYCFALGKLAFIGYYYILLLSAVARELTRRSLSYNVQEINPESPSLLRSAVGNARLSGLILLSVRGPLAEHARQLREEGLPVVSFTRRFDGISSVYDPLDELFRDVLERLFREGRRKILIVSWQDEAFTAMIRRGIGAACEAENVPEQQILLLDGTDEENGAKLKELLALGVEFDGVVFYSFFNLLYKMIAEKLEIREKCRLVCDETALPEQLNFTGYVINYRLEEAAKVLVDNLLLQMSDSAAPVIEAKIAYNLTLFRDGKPVSPA